MADLSKHADDAVRHYSGTITYRKDFDFPRSPEKGRVYLLSLGRVEVTAEVALNGVPCGITWCEPYRVDITAALRQGRNELTVRVADTWANRLIGDERLPQEKRKTWTTSTKLFPSDRSLSPSGLIGPVEVLQEYEKK